jgi:RimJ/RimL family protein N-acetyltransferase
MKHIVYRCDFGDRGVASLPAEECTPVIVASPVQALGLLAALVSVMGLTAALRLILRLCRHGRLFYYLSDQGQWMHWGGITLGWCRYYSIGAGEAVFGPVETAAAFRGRGVAVRAMREAMRALAGRGVRVFYVDTSEQNVAMQHAALKAGFKDTGIRYER